MVSLSFVAYQAAQLLFALALVAGLIWTIRRKHWKTSGVIVLFAFILTFFSPVRWEQEGMAGREAFSAEPQFEIPPRVEVDKPSYEEHMSSKWNSLKEESEEASP